MSFSAPAIMIDDFEELLPESVHPPTVGHLPSPVRPKAVKATDAHVQLVRQISFDLSRAEISSSSGGGRDASSSARPPFARVKSPNTIGQESPAFNGRIDDSLATDAEVSHHISTTIKRNRSFGDKKPVRAPSRATPSPQHMTRRQRANASPIITLQQLTSPPPPVKAGWGLSLAIPGDGSGSGSSGGGGCHFVRPPPIHTNLSLQSLDDESDAGAVQLPEGLSLVRPPALGFISEASAPPPTPRGGGGGFGGLNGFGGSRRESVPPMSLVSPHLYVGDEVAASDLDGLQAAGVTHVLNCSHMANALEGMDGAPRTYLRLGLLDNVSDLPRMQDALEQGTNFIAAALAGGGTVLVHCRAGISRSATLAMAYLVRATQQPVDVVFEKMRLKRRVVDPNLGYFVALHEWEKRVLRRPTSAAARSTPPLRAATPLEGMSLMGMSPARVRPLSRAG